MPPLDFPASPSVNQTYSGPGGVVWVWDGAKWVSGTGSTVYAPVTSPVFLGNPTAPNPPAGDADTSVATTSFVAAAVAPALGPLARSFIHNPLFNVAQRGAGPWTVTGYTADRWNRWTSTDVISASIAILADADRAAIGDEAARACLLTTFTGTGNGNGLYQNIEDVRRLSNKTLTISFWAIASAALKLGVSLDQLFGSGGSPSALVAGVGQAVTLTTGWARYSLTFAIASTSGKTLGTNGDHSTKLNFWYSAGAVNATASGNIGLQTGGINLWGVQLEIGSVATPLEKPDPRYDLANAQRFYRVTRVQAGGYGVTGTVVQAIGWPPVNMRAAPSVVEFADGGNNLGTVTYQTNVTDGSVGAILVTQTVATTGQWYMNKAVNLSADL